MILMIDILGNRLSPLQYLIRRYRQTDRHLFNGLF